MNTQAARRASLLVAASLVAAPLAAAAQTASPSGWRQHEITRPRPAAVATLPQTNPVPAPPDAVILFDGRDLSGWLSLDGGPARWKVENGYMQVEPGTGSILSKEEFGDVQLHVEWAAPDPPVGSSQDRGNSGVMLMRGRYEVQVLDSYRAETYADGQAGAIYGQYPPLFNASRAPGEWQTYDIYFRRPRFHANGTLAEPARMTVVHNGILVQHGETLRGETTYMHAGAYAAQPDQGPLQLQDHDHPVRYRNIWVRRLPERAQPAPDYQVRAVSLTPAQLDRFVGGYYRSADRGDAQASTPAYVIAREGNQLTVRIGANPPQVAIPVSDTQLWLTRTAATMTFVPTGGTTQVTFDMGGARSTAVRR